MAYLSIYRTYYIYEFMRQKYQVTKLLYQYFNQIQQDSSFIKMKRVHSKKYLFKTGDLINELYFVISGSVTLSFQQKQLSMPSQIIIGDFEPSNNLSRRTTTLKTNSVVEIAILPIDYYFNIKDQILQKQRFLASNILSQDKRIKYFASKYFNLISVTRGQEIKLQNSQPNDSDLALIRKGLFSIKKYIGVGIIKEHRIQVSRQFSLCQIGEQQFVRQNITCQSSKGQVFVCPSIYVNQLKQNFEEFSLQLLYKSRKDSVTARQSSIKSICYPGSELVNSILPSVFKKQSKKQKQKQQSVSSVKINKKNPRIKSQQSPKHAYENHYSIRRTNTNQLQLIPTFSNLSLIPLSKKGRLSKIKTTRHEIQGTNSQTSRNMQQSKLIKHPQIQEQQLIPKIFDNKFKRRMFYKVHNPFSHFKSKSLSLQEHIDKQKLDSKGYSFSIQNNMMNKKKSLRIYTNQFQG